MNATVEYREQYSFTLVPERARLFHRWAAHLGCSPQELFLDLLALGVAALVHQQLGLGPIDPVRVREPNYQEHLLDALADDLAVRELEKGEGR